MIDGIGIYGTVLYYSLTIAMMGSTALVFFYLWSKGRLDMDEEAKMEMHEMDEFHMRKRK